jgi:hypothetical protein
VNAAALGGWDEEHRSPRLRTSPAPLNHRWNPRHPGDLVGGVVMQDGVDPKTRHRYIVLRLARRTRPVTVWVSFTDLKRKIEAAAPVIGERLGITFLGERSGQAMYDVSLPERNSTAPDLPASEDTT